MILPLQISFRNLKVSEAIEARVREEVTKLETFCRDIMRCRVVIELPHKHHRKGDRYHVRIDLTVPGEEIVVKREPSLQATLRRAEVEKQSKAVEPQAAHKDVYVVIRDAFKEARRQLQDYMRRSHGQTKHRTPAPTGRVTRLFPEENYGFLQTSGGHEIYFHRNSVLNRAFDRLHIGSSVIFVEELGEKGPQASSVRAVRPSRPSVVSV